MFDLDFMPTAYETNSFTEIHICDEEGRLLFKTGNKQFASQWLTDNGFVKSSDISEYFDPEVGTICFFNAHRA